MSKHFLGEYFDIHGGGYDLLFPHHENERAQSCAVSGKPDCARFWLYNGMLLINGQKMSKSLGNFQTLHDALELYPAEILRWAFYSTHYRHPLDWTESLLAQASTCVHTVYRALEAAPVGDSDGPNTGQVDKRYVDENVLHALQDDLNSPLALSLIYKMALDLLSHPDNTELANRLHHTVPFIFGEVRHPAKQWLQNLNGIAITREEIEGKIQKRHALRLEKKFQEADALRKDLSAFSIGVEDRPDGTLWYRFWA